MRKRQHEIFAVCVHQTEGEIAMMIAAENRIEAEVIEGIMHPAHVPFEAEAETADIDRATNCRPRSRFLGDHQNPGMETVGLSIKLLKERNCGKVLAPAMLVGNPFAGAPSVVEIEHRGNRIHPNSIRVILRQPVVRTGEKKGANLIAREIEDVGIPLGLKSFARVEMLVERGAIEPPEAESVGGEMRRHPVEDDSDAALMERIDQISEIVGSTEARGRGEIAGDLVSPGASKRMLHDRHQLDMGEAEVDDIIAQLM